MCWYPCKNYSFNGKVIRYNSLKKCKFSTVEKESNMKLYVNKTQCTGCTACFSICPKKAITMEEDSEGFLYPVIDSLKCVECGKCVKICKQQTLLDCTEETEVFIGQNNDDEELKESSSGAIFPAIAQYILDQKGLVCGAAFDSENVCRHFIIDNREDLKKLQGSKYVQSSLGDVFERIEKYLAAGRIVLFSGTPCQVAGLKSYISDMRGTGKDDNLVLVDLLCHGCPSPAVFKKYLSYRQQEDNGDKIVKISFRDKAHGWRNFYNTYQYQNGAAYSVPCGEDLYFRGFLRNAFLRPSCYKCKFKQLERASDITLGDSWSMASIVPGVDNDKGHSFIISHTKKGAKIISDLDRVIHLVKISKTIENGGLYEPAFLNPERDKIFKNLDKMSFEKLYARYFSDRLILRIKRTIARKVQK